MKCFTRLLNNETGSTVFQYLATSLAMLSIVSSGLHYGWPSPSLKKLLADGSAIPITDDQGFWLATMNMFGALLGSILTPFLINNIGRKKVILLAAVPYFAAWMTIYIAWNVTVLLAARFVAGVSDGMAFSSVPIYTGEISQAKIRGSLSSLCSITFIAGILMINIVGSYLSIKTTALICSTVPVVLFCTFAWMPESPYYYIMKNRLEDARRSLQTFVGPKLASSELERIHQAVKEDQSKAKTNPVELFTVRRNLKAVGVMMIVRGAQQFSGVSAIVFYAQNIFGEAGGGLSAEAAAIAFFSVQIATCIACAGVADRWGRRPLLLVSTVGSCAALLVEGGYFYAKTTAGADVAGYGLVPVAALLAYIVFFSVGLQNVPIIIMSEIFNQDVKAIAMGFADIYFAFAATVTSKFFQETRDRFGMYFPFVFFALFCLTATVLTYFFVPETKGKTLEEIQEQFKGVKGRNGGGGASEEGDVIP
ncbi:unnamed protein product [Phyllotreta striolata]|uniref:Major facilitator superfamily (MFS) profile domain-containing protein n=1 Tax=Phyllotreta striolata TaxID=444603 RepID=A0A9N9TSC6_PHYSR|nr:unnamed protein product [Phyllotreta striolata]